MTPLQPGDLVFVNRGGTAFGTSVASVGTGWGGCSLNHVALVTHDGLIEATHDGVRMTTEAALLQGCAPVDAQGTLSLVGRLRAPHRSLVPAALAWAQQQLGKPYNPTFSSTLDSLYCSQLVVEAFRAAAGGPFFEETAMNFLDPQTGQFLPYWVDWYARFGQAIPQGAPGSHPGGLSLSQHLEVGRRQS